MNRKYLGVSAVMAMALSTTPAMAQSAAELRAQISQMRGSIAQGEAAGMDPAILDTFRDAVSELELSARELEASEVAAPAATGGAAGMSDAAPYPVRPNTLESGPACRGFTRDNYRDRALAGGDDTQLNTMCGQAYEYYVMYMRAISQGYSEADANRTYAAFEKAVANVTSFYQSAQ